jgi:cardiolipin synthase (CMP-forming)
MRASALNVANLLTVLRLCLVPVAVIAIINRQWTLAFVIFVAAGVTDAIDGYVARRFDLRTELGAYLDPLADKALLMSIYVTMAIGGHLPVWLAVLVVSRDIMIVGAVVLSWLMDKPVAINPSQLSKVNTAAQISFAALMLFILAFALDLGALVVAGTALVAVLTVGSMLAYLAAWLRHMSD